MTDRMTNVEAIRGMALSAAAAIGGHGAVNSEVEDDFDREQLKVKVRVGQGTARFTVNNVDLDYVLSHRTVRRTGRASRRPWPTFYPLSQRTPRWHE